MNPQFRDFLNAAWFPFLAYAVALIASAMAGLFVLREAGSKTARSYFWPEVALVFILLVLLKLFSAEAFVANQGREAARHGGWYNDRRLAQTIAAFSIAATALLLYPLAVWAYREARYRLPLATVFLLLTFLAIRALSLHQIDAVLYRRSFAGVQHNRLLEPSLALLVALSALLFLLVELLRHRRDHSRTTQARLRVGGPARHA